MARRKPCEPVCAGCGVAGGSFTSVGEACEVLARAGWSFNGSRRPARCRHCKRVTRPRAAERLVIPLELAEPPTPRVRRLFGKVERLVDRVVRHDWQDRALGRISKGRQDLDDAT